jgi:uncharacterized protein YutE (UPF0331/DUF86 family)
MDEKIVLAKIDELNSYLDELEQIKPNNLEEYVSSVKNRRACERLLQISVEAVIDICNILASQLRVGLPADEDEVFEKLAEKKVISKNMSLVLKAIKGFRNVLVHKYAKIDDELVFENLDKLNDFEKFKEEILSFLRKN